ncbi:MAG: YjgP/YjgQ family permease [Planctomycetaceae bacterium]|nr:MAG: YjgP/YjgQ family permease [Planctomycetaceae bacterium]
MTQIDRYILFLFARTILICFSSIGGVFVVFHAFNNLDELYRLAADSESMPLALISYYGPYMLMLFDWTAAIIALMAMLFTVGWLRRTGELTSLLAAGIRHGRILRPMLALVAAVILLQAYCRERLIPGHREILTNKPGDYRSEKVQSMLPAFDKSNGILIEGEGLRSAESSIDQPSFRLYAEFGAFGDVIDGESATWMPADGQRPAGYLVTAVLRPANIDRLASGRLGGKPVLLTAHDTDWLEPGQCFVVTTLDIEVLRDNPRSTRMAGIPELVRRIRNNSVHSSKDLHTLVHDRLLRPPLDFCLVLLGLPLVINRGDRRLFSVIGQTIGIVLVFFALKTTSAAMAGNGYLLSPAMAAWTPLLLLGPWAFVRWREAETQ